MSRLAGMAMRVRRHRRATGIVAALALVVAALLGGAMFWPLPPMPRERVFEIPPGTYQARMSGKAVAILPSQIQLTLGVQDILLLKNADAVPQIFGPVLIMPGQSFRLPFHQASDYQFECTAHASGQMTVVVAPEPTPGRARLAWRVRGVLRQLSG